MVVSLLAEIVPTWTMSFPATFLESLPDFFDDLFDGLLDSALQIHGIGAGRHGLTSLPVDGLGQDSRGGGPVACDVAGLAGDLTDHLGAHVLARILQIDLLGYRHPILRAGGRAELLLKDDVAALGAESHLDGIRQLVNSPQDCVPAIIGVDNFSCGHGFLLEPGVVGLDPTRGV